MSRSKGDSDAGRISAKRRECITDFSRVVPKSNESLGLITVVDAKLRSGTWIAELGESLVGAF